MYPTLELCGRCARPKRDCTCPRCPTCGALLPDLTHACPDCLRAQKACGLRVTFDDTPPDPDAPRPSWQPSLLDPMCAESLAQQRPLFEGVPQPKGWREPGKQPWPGDPGQQRMW